LDGVGCVWARKDPKAAAEAAKKLPPGAGRDRFISYIASDWAGTDPPAALVWVEQLPAGGAKDNAFAWFSAA
jgi:hypothetical protein